MNAKERIEWTDAEIALREVMDDDEALSALQILQARGWHPPARLISIKAERDLLRDQREQAMNVLGNFEDEENDEETPPLDVLAQRCYDWGNVAWGTAGRETDARYAAEARVEALNEALREIKEKLVMPPHSWRISEVHRIADAALAVARPEREGQ